MTFGLIIVKPKNIWVLFGATGNELPYYERAMNCPTTNEPYYERTLLRTGNELPYYERLGIKV